MPSKFVFPGGALDPSDLLVPLPDPPDATSLSGGPPPRAIAAAAIRELWEETGLILGQPTPWESPPAAWAGFAAAGYRPDPSALRHVFRARTPPGMARRFDARFFLAPATAVKGDPDALMGGDGELSTLAWVPLADVAALDLAPISRIVLASVQERLPDLSPPAVVPHLIL